MEIPAGFRFAPMDEELITHYLKQKKPGEPLPSCGPVIERDVYASEPWNIFSVHGDQWEAVNTNDKSEKKRAEYVIYVITPLKMASKIRVSRTAGSGTWKGQTKSKKIENQNNEVIGFKKMFTFEIKKKDAEIDENNTHWIMYEYSLRENVGVGDYVLCKIKRFELKEVKNKRNFEEISKRDGFNHPCGGSLLGEAQKSMKSNEEDRPNIQKSFDAIDVTPLSMVHVPDKPPLPEDDLDLGEDWEGYANYLNQQLQVDDDQQTNASQPSSSKGLDMKEDFNGFMNGLDMSATDTTTTSNGLLFSDTCGGNLLGEAQKSMKSKEEDSPNAREATALQMIHVSDIPPLPDEYFDLADHFDPDSADLHLDLDEDLYYGFIGDDFIFNLDV